MRINSIPPKDLIGKYFHVKPSVAVQRPSQGVDKAELTSEAKTFSTFLKTAKDEIEVRTSADTERVNEISSQVKNGTYSVPGTKVAQKILGK